MNNVDQVPAAPDQHEHYQILMMGFIDDELTETDQTKFRQHLDSCAECNRELVEYRHLADTANAVRLREPQDHELDRFWASLYNRMERSTGWVLVLLGVVLITAIIVVEIAKTDWLAWWLKVGVAAVVIGLALLFLNVLRERIRTLPFDRYRKVHR